MADGAPGITGSPSEKVLPLAARAVDAPPGNSAQKSTVDVHRIDRASRTKTQPPGKEGSVLRIMLPTW